MPPSIKLTYFDFKGLGESIRILLKYGNVEFEDNRISREDWPALKPSTPFGQMPLYEEDGKVMYQSLAICRYVAKKVKLVGDTEWENLEIDAIVDTITDFRLKISPIYQEQDVARKARLLNTFKTETVPFYFERLDKIAGENGGYLAAKKLTWADIIFYHVNDFLPMFLDEGYLSKYKNLTKVTQNVAKVPNIKKWIDTRPKDNI